MELVTISHDEFGVYVLGTPYSRKTLLPHIKRLHRFDYLVGDTKPNFPLPVTSNTAATMLFADQGEYGLAAMWCDGLDEIDLKIIDEMSVMFGDY